MPFKKENKENDIIVDNDNMEQENKDIASAYVNGLNDSDKALKYLIDYFSEIKEPTVICYYGDHIPLLGEQQAVFKSENYFSDSPEKNELKEYNTPFMIWNNYGLENKKYDYIDSSYLGAVLLNTIGYKKDAYINFLIDEMKTIKAYKNPIYINNNNNLKNVSSMNSKEKEVLNNNWLLMYDRIFGEKYSEKED